MSHCGTPILFEHYRGIATKEAAEKTLSEVIVYYNTLDDESDTNLASKVYLFVNDAIARLLFFPEMVFLYHKERNV